MVRCLDSGLILFLISTFIIKVKGPIPKDLESGVKKHAPPQSSGRGPGSGSEPVSGDVRVLYLQKS